jgi:hypothetical protein
MQPSVLLIPGLWNSGPQHWQTHWEVKHPDWRRVQQRDFNRADRDEWVCIEALLAFAEAQPLICDDEMQQRFFETAAAEVLVERIHCIVDTGDFGVIQSCFHSAQDSSRSARARERNRVRACS